MHMLTGMMASVPYARENKVSPVEMRFVVRYAQSTPGCFFHPFALRLAQALAQAIEDCVITDLSLTIAILIVRGGEPVGDFVLETEVRHMLACEVGSIVGDDGMRNIEATNNVLPKELHCLLSRDFGEQHRLYPLGEVVGNQEEPNWGRAHGRGPTTSSPHCMKGQGLYRV